ncbi:MAG: c-type cytochrome [Acidobacteriaceae bacterium]
MHQKIALILAIAGMSAALYGLQATPNPAATTAKPAPTPAWMRKMWPNLPPNQNPAQVASGKALFESNCSFCHGTDATGGNGGPDLIRSVLVNHDENGNLIGPTVRNGRPGKGMPAFKNFSDAQVDDLVAFLHQQNRNDRIRFNYKILNVDVGNAAAGKVYFQAHCAQCHSATGDLDGIAKKYDAAALQQLWLDPGHAPQANDNGPKKTVTVTLASGKKFSGTLQHIDEFNVSLYDANGGYHSFPIKPGMSVVVHNPLAAHEELLGDLTDTEMHNVTTYLETLK